MPNKLSQFWQELKRRKVVRVITVYAAASFVILELVSIIAEPLKLPEWFLPMVIVLLCIGFIVAIILSWIYDIHPEGGIVKTDPADMVKNEDKPKSSKGWKIASYISFVVIVGLIVLNIIPRTGKKEVLEKSIAVLPLLNLSSSEDISSIGFTDEIIMELQKIKAFDRVLSLTSTMQYANQRPTIPEIGEKLKVNYLVEGTIQKQNEKISINVQVIIAREDDHIWGKEFEDVWENRFNIQDEIAFKVAKELKLILSPSEIEHIEKLPTTNLTAHDFYQRGREEYLKYTVDYNKEALENAENLYYNALEYDSTFAKAYAGLAWVYYSRNVFSESEYFSETYLDSVLILADIALSYDDQLAEAYSVKGRYYYRDGNIEQANEEYDKALKFNPNDYQAYEGKGLVAATAQDIVKKIYYYHKAASLSRGPALPGLLRRIGGAYNMAGFQEKAKFYFHESLKLNGDSVEYYLRLSGAERVFGKFEKAIESGLNGYAIDSLHPTILSGLGCSYLFDGQYEESLKYYEKYIEGSETLGNISIDYLYYIGYAYWQNGYKEEAEYYFDELKRLSKETIRLNRREAQILRVYYHLAAIYAFRGEKEKAYENLRFYNQREVMNQQRVNSIKNDPIFDNIRDEPEFLKIKSELIAKYQAEHERVRQWLEENDML